MIDGRTYKARLQYLRENPYLCDAFEPEKSSYVPPKRVRSAYGNLTEAVALLASRGNCPFQQKALTAESVDSAVIYLIVYNYNEDGEDTLVPMFSEYGRTRLILLSVTHRCGQALKRYIHDQPYEVLEEGGPIIELDSETPEGLLTMDDLQNMLLSALGLFFMLISFSGCLIICAGTYGQLSGNGRIVVSSNGVAQRLLTEEQVRQLSDRVSAEMANEMAAAAAAAAGASNTDDSNGPEEESCCSVCIEELQDNDQDVIVLPCKHKFHADCIMPWLTERQSKCPLCKYDVMEYARNQETEATQANISWFDRIVRYRWTQVEGQDEGHRDGIMISAEEMEVTLELELTEQHRVC